ncbi:MAG: type VI secretion system tip protein VgrG [Pseudomonadota bacterium]
MLSRRITFESALGESLLFNSMTGRETLGRPFTYDLELLSRDERVDLSALLGKPATVLLTRHDGLPRPFNGIVTHFSLAGEVSDGYVRYRARMRPWLWLMSYRTNSRIFQNKTVPDVLKELFREHGFTDLEERLSSEYRTWEYLVQYRESDFNFVSRLMEQEGIYYYFKHDYDKHTLVLADSYSAHDRGMRLPYYPPLERERRDHEHVNGWLVTHQIRPGAYASADFNFERPAAPLLSQLAQPNKHPRGDYEVFDYPGEFRELNEGDVQVRLRLEELQADYEVIQGSATARDLMAGSLFELYDFPRDDQNKEYLVIEAVYDLRASEYEAGGARDPEPDYRVRFQAMDAKKPFRTPCVTKKPVVEGPQTAVVVGQQDQEIWTDQYGRVKVQFHWDRYGTYDENSSCWVRVAQIWAGNGFGGIHLPRIGQEVIVDFLEGDPDRPIITGRVYNADNMPPYTLPENRTQSGIKSRSSKGGTPENFNEIRFEDKKGEEELFIQAERNQTTNVKANQSISVGANQSVSVSGNQSISVQGERSVTVTKKDSETFKDTRDVTVHLADTLTLKNTHLGKYQGGREVIVEKYDKTTVSGADKTTSVNGKYGIVADVEYKVTHKSNELLLKDSEVVLKNASCKISLDGGVLKITAADELTLQCGAASISLKSDGTVSISGTNKVSAAVNTSMLELAPAGASMSGQKAAVSGMALTEITGGMVKIN